MRKQLETFGLMNEVIKDVIRERFSQIKKYGVQRRPIGQWLAILGEEHGEVCQAAQFELGVETTKPTDATNLYIELIHEAAVCVAIAEQLREKGITEMEEDYFKEHWEKIKKVTQTAWEQVKNYETKQDK